MKWRQVILVGCAGMLLLCIALPFIPYFWRVRQASLARQRWEQNGADNYTIIVTRTCFCPEVDEFKLTVQDGLVIAVEPTNGLLTTPLVPTDFSDLTIHAMLRQAENAARWSWDVLWFRTLDIQYDDEYGYVTKHIGDANGWFTRLRGIVFATEYIYFARDLQFTEP